MGRTIAWVISIGVLLLTGVPGIHEGLTEWSGGRTAFQHSVTATVLLYGVLGLVTAYGLFRRRRWSVGTAIAWGIAITYAPGAAVISDGDKDATPVAVFAASGACALIALGVIWTANVTTRRSKQIEELGVRQ